MATHSVDRRSWTLTAQADWRIQAHKGGRARPPWYKVTGTDSSAERGPRMLGDPAVCDRWDELIVDQRGNPPLERWVAYVSTLGPPPPADCGLGDGGPG